MITALYVLVTVAFWAGVAGFLFFSGVLTSRFYDRYLDPTRPRKARTR